MMPMQMTWQTTNNRLGARSHDCEMIAAMLVPNWHSLKRLNGKLKHTHILDL
jgi:hypothetical protein